MTDHSVPVPEHPRFIDLTGRQFGRWTVIAYAGKVGKNKHWLCRCECGTEKKVHAGNLSSGKTKGCGCPNHKSRCVICGADFWARIPQQEACSSGCSLERRRRWYKGWEHKNRDKRRAQERARYYADHDRVRQRKAAWRQANADRVRQISRRWREKNPEKRLEAERRWIDANRDTVREKWRRNARKHRAKRCAASLVRYYANPQRRIEQNRIWQKNNPDRMRVHRRNVRARRRAAPGKHTAEDVAAIMKAQKHRCAYCRTKLTKKNAEIDHIISLARGGSNDRRNLQATCGACNRRKFAKDPIAFAQANGLLL